MNSPGAGRSSHPHWKKLYEAALLELDVEKLPSRIEEAKRAIHNELVELASSDQNRCEPLMDALNILDDLRRMDLAHRREELKRKAEH